MPLYDRVAGERDACGIGFVADQRGRSSRAIVETGIEALCRVKHRGALAADALTGDGAGLLLPLPHDLLGADPRSGVAMLFADPDRLDRAQRLVEEACALEGLEVERWREVPVERGALGETARTSEPAIQQAILSRPLGSDTSEGERRAFRARRRIEQAAVADGIRLYVASFSFLTITYKALCAADRLADFYPDLCDDRFTGWFTIFHQRFATNTTPTWERAQPFRFLAHNGEINTIRGNIAWMRAREGRLGATELGPEELLRPVVSPAGSDSAILDEALELLTRGGRSVAHAVSMLLPSPWENVVGLDPEVADLFHYHACLLEPWDGPAGLVFSDGERVGAALDRNGLRPLRVSVCDDGLVACSSEAGAIPTRGHGRVQRGKIGPGQVFLIDPAEGGVLRNADIKKRLARRRPYGEWLSEHLTEATVGQPVEAPAHDVTPRQVAAGMTKEEVTVVLRPMATDAQEPTSSMGDDTPQPPLARFSRPVFAFLKQRFAQVTNPPIDHLRERHVMSISTRLGPRDPLLQERPEAPAGLREYPSPLLFPDAVASLELEGGLRLDATFDPALGAQALEQALGSLSDAAVRAVKDGVRHLVVSDHSAGRDRVAMPSALAAGAVHQALLDDGSRLLTSLVVEASDVRESHHVACLLTIGVDAVCPRLALDAIAQLAATGRLGGGVEADEAQRRFFKAIEDGLLKIMSKMGISTLDSYRGAQIIESMGLATSVTERCFAGVSSALGGLTFEDLAEHCLERHAAAYASKPVLANVGAIKHRSGGEYHAINPEVVESLHGAVGYERKTDATELDAAHALQRAAKGDDDSYRRFAQLVNERVPAEPRDLLETIAAGPPLPLEQVEPVGDITRRFSTGAMSHGALSAEAHETLSVALNMIGGMANTGEGGEAPERFRDERNSGIKQIASGRFGVTPAYLVNAKELQIKMAQGSKPGEGGQLPGKKVTVEIARLRHTVPGVALISPPPHHDIYSIEDLAQLVFDLKQANPDAAVSVKLVASEGIGTIAAGVVKGLAEVVHIAGGDGGTGASPLSSIKNAGMPWELGLAEVQDALVSNGLRSRTRLRVDGGLKTGRDIVIAALLGADEFSFGTAALVAEGCILVRTCHRDTCPVGIATQNPTLRAKFAGTPEMVARYLTLVAKEARELLASLGLRSLEEATGRTDLLRQATTTGVDSRGLDLSPLLVDPSGADARFIAPLSMQRPRSALGDRLHDDAVAALAKGESAELRYDISTSDRTVGARLGCALASNRIDDEGGARIVATFEGDAGQSFGAFLFGPVELRLTGEANDYVCKGMGGGRVVITPPSNDAGDPYLAGNTVLYGATGGQLFIAGMAGERFAVRNSGAVAVVEGVGDHACEYMTAGAVVILGPTGRNLGAGMSGGEAYVYDPEDELVANLNPQLVATYEPSLAQLESLKRVIELHATATGSAIGTAIAEEWDALSGFFKRVAPVAEVARLEALFEGTAAASA